MHYRIINGISEIGRPSIPPERLLKASILIALHSVRSDRLFCEMLDRHILFRWFLDMNLEEPALDASTFSKNRERLITHEVAGEFFDAVVELTRVEGLLSGVNSNTANAAHGYAETIVRGFAHDLVLEAAAAALARDRRRQSAAAVRRWHGCTLPIIGRGFGVPMQGSLGLFVLASAFALFACLAIGVFVATLAQNLQQALLVAFFILFPMMFLSGTIVPLESTPPAMQALSFLSPIRYYMEIDFGILLKGVGLDILWPQFLALAVFGPVLAGLGLARLRRRLYG
jgi:transposase